MSRENAEIVRQAIDAYNRDQDALDLFDPEIEWVTTGRFVEPDTYRGHEDVRRYLQALRDDFEDLHVESHELVNAGDHVIAPVRGGPAAMKGATGLGTWERSRWARFYPIGSGGNLGRPPRGAGQTRCKLGSIQGVLRGSREVENPIPKPDPALRLGRFQM